MLCESYDFTVDLSVVAVELNVAGPIAYPLARTLSVAYFILKLLRISKTIT